MRKIELSPRLLSLAKQVPQDSCFADIGTDHGRLPVWLLEHQIIQRAIATDLREGPLSQAELTASRHQVKNRIAFRMGDGLRPISNGECDVIAIAGMGGETITEILAGVSWASDGGSRFLLQPMTSAPDLRRWLWRSGFVIEREELVREEKLYVTLTVVGGQMPPLTPAEEWAGRQERGRLAPLRGEYLSLMIGRAEKILAGLRQSENLGQREKLAAWANLVEGLLELKREWESWQP